MRRSAGESSLPTPSAPRAAGGGKKEPSLPDESFLPVKGGIERVYVLAVEFFLSNVQRLAETLEMHDLSRAQKTQRGDDVGIVKQAEQIVVNNSCFLLCCDRAGTTWGRNLQSRNVRQKFQWISMGTSRVPGIRLPTAM